MVVLPTTRTHAIEHSAVGRDLGWAVWSRGRSLPTVELLEDGITGAAGLDPKDRAIAILLSALAVVVVGIATLARCADQHVADEQHGIVMRLVAEAVVLASRERVETPKSGAIRAHSKHRATVRVAAQGGAAVEELPGGDQRTARPCAIGT